MEGEVKDGHSIMPLAQGDWEKGQVCETSGGAVPGVDDSFWVYFSFPGGRGSGTRFLTGGMLRR